MKARDIMRAEVHTIEASATVGQALQQMLWMDIRHLPVVEDGRLVGLLSERDVLRTRGDAAGNRVLVAQAMSSPVQVARPDDPLEAVADRMITQRLGCLPVVDELHLVGLLTRSDLLAWQYRENLGTEQPATVTVADVMTRAPATVAPSDTLYLALSLMMGGGIRHLPVVDREGHVIGIMSDRDIRTTIGDPMSLLSGPRAYDEVLATPVARMMTVEPVVVPRNAAIEVVAQRLMVHRLSAVPVVDEQGRLVGIVSYIDLLRHFTGDVEAQA